MNDHPLTDEMIKDMWLNGLIDSGYVRREFNEDDMRAAYDKGRDDQLEQALHWLRTTQWYLNPSTLADLLEEAMRPQENNS